MLIFNLNFSFRKRKTFPRLKQRSNIPVSLENKLYQDLSGCERDVQLHTQDAIADNKMSTAQYLGPPASSTEKKMPSQNSVNFEEEDSKNSAVYEIPQPYDKTAPKNWENFDDTEEPYEMPYHYPTAPYIPSNLTPTYSTQE